MTSPYGPPGYPPAGPPPGGPARGSSVVTVLLAALFVVATAVAAVLVHAQDPPEAPTAGAAPPPVTGPVAPSGGNASASYAVPSVTPTYPTPTYPTPTLPSTSYVPPPVPSPTPTRIPLDPQLVNRTFALFMNGLANRSLSQVRSVTCPKLRKKTIGTALDRKYINRWRSAAYQIPYYQDYVIISVSVRYVNPNTGGDGGLGRYRFYVDRYPDGNYWVCGYL